MAFLGLDGLKVLIQLIKGSLDKKADKDLATTSTNGLMSSADKTKLDGVATGANNYTHPSYTAKASGLYKTTIDNTGHVSAATAVAKSDITALGIPSSDTTYSAATTSANGLMSSTDKAKLDGVAAGANNYTHPSYTAKTSGLYRMTVDDTGHVSATAAVAKSDITALGIPDSNTTYSVATTTANGLMSSADKTKLDGVATGANNYTHPTTAGNIHIPSGGATGNVLAYGGSSGTAAWTDISTGNMATATKLQTARYIDGVSFNGTSNITHYFACSSNAADVVKVISAGALSSTTGTRIEIQFTNGSTATSFEIQYDTSYNRVSAYCNGSTTMPVIAAGSIVQFVYNATSGSVGFHMLSSTYVPLPPVFNASGGDPRWLATGGDDGKTAWEAPLQTLSSSSHSPGNLPSADAVYNFVNDNYAKSANLGTCQILGYEYVTVTYSTMIADGASATASATFTGVSGATNYVASLVKMSYLNPSGVSIDATNKTLTVSLLNASGGTHSGNCQYLLTAYKKV